MSRLGLALVVTLGPALGLTACTPADRHEDLRPPPDFVPPPIRPLRVVAPQGLLGFGPGFFGPEWEGAGPDMRRWRWMGAHGEVRFENDHRPHTLRLAGWVPLELLGAPPTVTLRLGDHTLDKFVADERSLRKEYAIDPAWLGGQGFVVLVIETSTTARAPNDSRDLGLAIEHVGWR